MGLGPRSNAHVLVSSSRASRLHASIGPRMVQRLEPNDGVRCTDHQGQHHRRDEDEDDVEQRLSDAHAELRSLQLLAIVDDLRFGQVNQHITDRGRTVLHGCILRLAATNSENELTRRNRQGQAVHVDMDHLLRRYALQADDLTATTYLDHHIGWNLVRHGTGVVVEGGLTRTVLLGNSLPVHRRNEKDELRPHARRLVGFTERENVRQTSSNDRPFRDHLLIVVVVGIVVEGQGRLSTATA